MLPTGILASFCFTTASVATVEILTKIPSLLHNTRHFKGIIFFQLNYAIEASLEKLEQNAPEAAAKLYKTLAKKLIDFIQKQICCLVSSVADT